MRTRAAECAHLGRRGCRLAARRRWRGGARRRPARFSWICPRCPRLPDERV